ncbi:Rxlr effector protein, partial [Globisporangium splendens]
MPLFISSTRWGSQPEHAEFVPPPSGGCSGGGSVIGRNSENSWLLRMGRWLLIGSCLSLGAQHDPYLEGIRVTKSGAEPHLISTFVDDSAVFLKQGKQLPRLMQLLTEFGQQSGLHVQPTKSSDICLNTAVVQEQRCGIPILKHGETVRYLGIQIGTGNITQANWEDRLQKLRTRLIIATKVSNSVVGRVLLLNSVLLPSILFTAGYIKPPSEGRGPASESTKAIFVEIDTRHKVSPSLLYLPVKEGGIGLYSIPLAIKRQAMRRTTRWLQRVRDRYTEAWHEQVHQDKSQNWGCCAISPKERSQHAQTRLYQTNNIHRLGWEYLGEDLVAAEGRNPAWKDDLKRQMESLLPTVDLEWRSDGRVGVCFGRKPEQTIHQLSEETRAFWPSFQWNDNPWIIDSQGEQYTVKTVSFLKECNLASFNVKREEERVFSVRLPTMTATLTSKRRAVLRKLVTSIILCSPEIEIDAGNQLISHQEPWSRKPTKREYKWISNGMGTIIAMPVSERSHTDYIQMQRQANGVLWTVTDWTGDATCQQDVAMIEEEIKTVGWTFKPHPFTTHCPWLVHERTPPNSIQKTIDRARTRRLHSKLYQGLGVLVDKLNEVAKTDRWYSHVQYRLPADLWKQRGCLTPYQMWTTYRISAMQLNLFHPGRIESSACPSNAGCGETKETISHIVWSCKRAQAAWMAFLGRWIGRTLTEQALNLFLPHIASRTAPPGQRSLLRELEKSFGFITPEHSTALQKLWFIVTSSIPVLLWRTRVEIVHEQQHVTIEESTKRVWTAVLERQDLSRQLEAWATARLYFDGGARGNPGPGGSGWALILLNERTNRWELKACGYAYMGPEVTNNRCEYSALKDGLAYSAHYLQHYEVKLEVFGDSQMIIASQNGFSSIRQTELQPLAVRVNQTIVNFAWISWNHTKREQNKMADLLANMAMNSKSAKILTDESRGNDQILMSQVAVLLDNDIGATPSKLRNTSLFLIISSAHPENNTRTDAAVREARHRAWVQRLTKIATRPWKTKPDDDLRKMVPAEEEALNAWIMGALVLDAPPAFLAYTHTFLQRMAYVKFFEDCLEGTVVAVVPPRILMPEHIAEKTILMQLLASEPAGSAGYKNLSGPSQRSGIDEKLNFATKKLVLLSTAKLEEEDDRCDIDNVIPRQTDALQYQVRVVAPGLGNDIVGQLIALSTECEVVSIARAPRARDGAYDSNFWVVIFNSEECPPQLKDVTHISAQGFSIFVHHHQRYSRIPCFQCFDPSHPKSKCTRAPGDRQMQFRRDFEPEIKQAKEMSKFELQHMSLEVRQKYIGNLSNSLGKVMANLKSKATEKALLSEMLQPTDSNSSTGTAAVAAVVNSATDAQSVTPSEAEWFDPANLKKPKGAMKSTISTSATTPVKSSPASKGQPHPASDAASAGRRAPKGGILKAAPKLTSVVGTSPGTVASSGSIGTGSPETSVKASNGQSNRKALQARKKRELELESILAGNLSSADSVLDGVQANSTQAKQKVAIDARLSAAQATLDIAKEHLSKACSAHTAAAAAAATAKRKFHDVSAKAHSFALDRDEHKEADTSGRDEESSSANREAGHFQRQIELLDLQQRVTAKEAAAASLILQEAKNAKNRAKRQLDLLKKRAKAKNLGPKDGDQHAGNKASTTAASGSSPAENTESQGDQDLAYTKLREFVKAHVVHEHSPTAQTQDEEQSRTSQPGSKSFPSASRDNGSANQQPSSEPSADTTSGCSEDPSHFDVTMSLADSTSMDSTMHLQDLTGGAVTPPNGQAALPLPAEVTKAFHQEMRSQNGTEDAGNGPPSMNQPTPGSADQDFGHIDSTESRDADPTSVFGSGPEINAAMGSGLGTGSTDDEHRFQEPEREPDSHTHTLNRPRARKIPELASSVLKAAASTTPGQSEASQESTFSNDSESSEFETPPSSPSHSVQDDGQVRKSLVGRLVGSKEELEQLTAAEQALRRQHFRANNKAMHDWTTATRQNRRFSLPSVDPSDVSKLIGWIPSHVDALSALICALPFPLEVLRMFPVKKLLDFGHSINSQAQRALIRHHSADGAVSAQVRAFCKKWASAVDACPQGSARWSMTDNIKQWNRLEKLDDSLLTATVSRPIDPDKWAILNVISLLLPSMFPRHEAVGHVMPETRAEEY